jgi:hypothetical protein
MKYAEDMQSHDDNSAFDAMLTRSLERRDEVVVPLNFATRVVAALPPPRKPRKAMQLGRMTAVVALFVLAIALFALAPHAAPSFGNLAFDFELILLAQLAGIGYWLTARQGV